MRRFEGLVREQRNGFLRRVGARIGALALPGSLIGVFCLAGCAEEGTPGEQLGDGGVSTTDPHASHHSAGDDAGLHDGTAHESTHTSHSTDPGATEHVGTDHAVDAGHDGTGHSNSDTGHSDTGHSDTGHSDTGHSDTGHSDAGHSDTHTNASTHAGDPSHADSTADHTATEHRSTAHESSGHHVDDSATDTESDGTHAHTDETADASVSGETDTSAVTAETHEHSGIDLSDDAGVDADAAVDTSSHDHESTDEAEPDAGVVTDTPTSTEHDHSTATDATSSTSTSTTTNSTSTSTADSSDEHTDHEEDHCLVGYAPEPSDAAMDDGFDIYVETRNGQDYPDATIQTEAIEWMEQHYWQEAHFQWHQARRCPKQPTSDPNDIEICEYPEFVQSNNECENEANGVEFLAMHRHMIQSLKQLWPNHTEQFEGWDHFPTEADYPELLQTYFVDWSNSVLSAANIADNIESNAWRFDNEGAFGKWIQCGGFANGTFWANLHGALHFNGYSADNQGHSVANQRRNLDAYLFWKLHGWIDKVWERYRVAKGLTNDLTPQIVEQCQEMHRLSGLVESLWGPVEPPDPDPEPEEVVESGYFHEEVRPFLEEARCRGCHGESSPSAGLQLGFLTSTEIVEQLVNQPSMDAVGQTLVVPGEPEQSWLYLKISGQSETATSVECQASAPECHQSMPQGNGPMSEDAQAAIYQWIADGALPPTIEN